MAIFQSSVRLDSRSRMRPSASRSDALSPSRPKVVRLTTRPSPMEKGYADGQAHISRHAGLNFFRPQRDLVIEPVVAPLAARVERIASGGKLARKAVIAGDPRNSLAALPDEIARHALGDVQGDRGFAL